ncbi:hypothetical protein EDM68_01865 [Candidatus Uhrbacteria bacterium]|nr:MAG: hypothetical protein EDM68_01865 [Candidatus Uhrbacteria bacterium]
MDSKKRTLIVRLFSFFPTDGHALCFEDLLRVARLEVTPETIRTLDAGARRRALSHVHAWLRAMASDWDGPLVLFAWFHQTLAGTLSSLGTLDHFVPDLRRARKVVVVPDDLWPSLVGSGSDSEDGWFRVPYASLDGCESESRSAFVLRLDAHQASFRTAVELGLFLGTRTSRRSAADLPVIGADEDEPTATGPPTPPLGVSSSPTREDETLEIAVGKHPLPVRVRHPSNGAVEVRRLGSGRPDPRCEDEDLRDTIEPPPPSPRDDPTKPKL